MIFCVFYVEWSKEVDTNIGKKLCLSWWEIKTGRGAMPGCMFSTLNHLHKEQQNFCLVDNKNTWHRCWTNALKGSFPWITRLKSYFKSFLSFLELRIQEFFWREEKVLLSGWMPSDSILQNCWRSSFRLLRVFLLEIWKTKVFFTDSFPSEQQVENSGYCEEGFQPKQKTRWVDNWLGTLEEPWEAVAMRGTNWLLTGFVEEKFRRFQPLGRYFTWI